MAVAQDILCDPETHYNLVRWWHKDYISYSMLVLTKILIRNVNLSSSMEHQEQEEIKCKSTVPFHSFVALVFYYSNFPSVNGFIGTCSLLSLSLLNISADC